MVLANDEGAAEQKGTRMGRGRDARQRAVSGGVCLREGNLGGISLICEWANEVCESDDSQQFVQQFVQG